MGDKLLGQKNTVREIFLLSCNDSYWPNILNIFLSLNTIGVFWTQMPNSTLHKFVRSTQLFTRPIIVGRDQDWKTITCRPQRNERRYVALKCIQLHTNNG